MGHATMRARIRRLRFAAWMALGIGAAHGAAAQSPPVVDAARAALPDAIRTAGVLRVATSLQWPPFDYTAEGTGPEGIDIRLVKLLAAKLGLRAEITDVKFPAIVPGVADGRFDIGVDQIDRTAERAKTVDFLSYFNAGYGLLVRKGVSDVDVNHLCGRTLVLTQGSSQIAIAQALSADCTKTGDKPITTLFFPDSADTYLALANGRGDGFLTGNAVGVYIAKGNDKLAMTTPTLPGRSSVAGIVMAKGSTALHEALQQALESAVADGSYMKIMTEFGVPDSALTVAQIRNPPPL